MPKFKKSQEVKQFSDDEIICEQEVSLDTEDLEGWMVVTHNGESFSLSVDNWKLLVELADVVLKQSEA